MYCKFIFRAVIPLFVSFVFEGQLFNAVVDICCFKNISRVYRSSAISFFFFFVNNAVKSNIWLCYT